MHLYNAWLPPPVAELAVKEKEAFTEVVNTIKSTWHPQDPASAFATLKWIPIVRNFLKAKSEIALEDVKVLIEAGLDIFFQSQHNLMVQVRWGNLLARLLKKHGKKLDLKILWRPFYNLLVQIHFKRCQSAEGLSLKRNHLDALKSLIHYSRRFFPPGSAEEIWLEFRSLMDNLWHNSALEGVGFLQLFLPTNPVNCGFYNSNWIKDGLDLWAGMPKCQFWDFQWASIMCRVIKNCPTIDWECFLPVLFTQYLNIFEVPVANNSASYPFSRTDIPGSTISVFCSRKLSAIMIDIAKSIVFLLKPGGSGQVYFENMVNLLEQYYHPSNGGWWTYSLERFLRYLVYYFQKRLSQEQRNAEVGSIVDQNILGKLERTAFVRVVLKLIERGQYSKSDALAETAVSAASVLSYVEPSLVLPFVVSRFHIALDTMTAPHQFKSAIAAVALASRALLLSSAEASENVSLSTDYKHALMVSICNTLLGMDVNDPPKTLATMQLYGSIFSSIARIDDKEDGSMLMMLDINFSEWLDEFLSRLFSLLLHLEPNSQSNEGQFLAPASGTFLVEDGSFYFCLLEILLGKLTRPLYNQALKKISKFVHNHILPGAAAEVGLLCSATLYPNPAEAVVHLSQPMIHSVLSSLKDSPSTGISSNRTLSASSAEKVSLSPGLEASVAYRLNVLSVAINFGGPHLLQIQEELKDAISAAFDAPSWKVNEAGNHLLRSLIGSLILYYPLDQYKCILSHPRIKGLEEWISKKENNTEEVLAGPKWHIPNKEEIAYANELLNLHLISALAKLKQICQTENQQESGYDKQYLRVILLQIDASLQGARSCLPDFNPMPRDGKHENEKHNTTFIWGAAGVSIGSVELRQETAEIIDITCKYILTHSADNSMLLELLVDILDALANYGSLEYVEWSNNYRAHLDAGRLDPAAIKEPSTNYITGFSTQGKRRPRWALIDYADMHNTWRASQSGYHKYRLDDSISLPEHIILLTNDLLDLTMKEYDGVRRIAGKSLIKLLKRFPSLIKHCMPKLTASLGNPGTPEHAALGSCAILQSRIVMRHIMKDWSAFSSFVLALLGSSHHESLKAQKAISELFIGFNLQYTGLPRNKSQSCTESSDKSAYMSVITQIRSLSSDVQNVHWRYNLMAHRILLLMVLPSNDKFEFSSKAREEVACHFLVHLKSHLPPVRVLAAASLVILLQASPYKKSINDNLQWSCLNVPTESSLENALNPIITGEGFFKDMLNGLTCDHIFADSNNTSGGGNRITQSIRDKSINGWFQAFFDPWPRSRNWNSLLCGSAFLPSFAKLFKRLVQECGETVLQALQNPLEELLIAKEERDKQCLASEVLAGLLNSDVILVLEAWESWLCTAVHKVVRQPTVETNAEWATCMRFAVTGKGRDGKAIPLMRQKILECLAEPLSMTVATHMVAKRFTLLSAALIETSPSCMPATEITLQENLLEEVLNCMGHSAAQVRESIGTLLSILCSNLRLNSAFGKQASSLMERLDWTAFLVERAGLCATKIHNASKSNVIDGQLLSSDDKNYKGDTEEQEHIKWMETVFYFVISALKSGRALVLTDIIVGLLYPVIALQETLHKELSNLARAAMELLKWQIVPQPYVSSAVSVLISATNDTSWHTRIATLMFLQSFMYRHIFLLSSSETEHVWDQLQNLLTDEQVEVREQAATVLSGLMRGRNDKVVKAFRESSLKEALLLQKGRKTRFSKAGSSLACKHGMVLALSSLVLSVPYDMPSWLPDTVTLLANFNGEPSPVKSTVMKTIAEFRRTHADTWALQKESFTEEQLEVLADSSSSLSYFA